jgi:hypothetical protein
MCNLNYYNSSWKGEALVNIFKSLDLKISHLGPSRRTKMAAKAAPARNLFCMICSIACCNPIERDTALYSVCKPPHYPQLTPERFRGAAPAADGPPPPPIVGVHGLTAHPVIFKNVQQFFFFEINKILW